MKFPSLPNSVEPNKVSLWHVKFEGATDATYIELVQGEWSKVSIHEQVILSELTYCK
jgi:hypothetical protein